MSYRHRYDVLQFSQLPHINKTLEKQLHKLGIHQPVELIGKDPRLLYAHIERSQAERDPCLLDILVSAVHYMEGIEVNKWWEPSKGV